MYDVFITVSYIHSYCELAVCFDPDTSVRCSHAASNLLAQNQAKMWVPWRQPHCHSGLATLPSVGAVP